MSSSATDSGRVPRGAASIRGAGQSPSIRQFEAKVARLEKEPTTAHTILEVQGNAPRPPRPSCPERNSGEFLRKVAGLLGFSLNDGKDC